MSHYDGKALAEWLFAQPEIRSLDDSRRRTIRHWAAGINPSEPAVDSLLCEVGLHLRDVPVRALTGWPEIACRGLEIDWRIDGTPYPRRAA